MFFIDVKQDLATFESDQRAAGVCFAFECIKCSFQYDTFDFSVFILCILICGWLVSLSIYSPMITVDGRMA